MEFCAIQELGWYRGLFVPCRSFLTRDFLLYRKLRYSKSRLRTLALIFLCTGARKEISSFAARAPRGEQGKINLLYSFAIGSIFVVKENGDEGKIRAN